MSLEQNRMVEIYLDTVCSQIKWREVHGQVKSELLSHLEEIVLELISDGSSKQEAITTAIHRMGDATDLGRQLQQTHAPQRNWPLVATVALLSGLGLAVMYMMETSEALIGSLHVFIKSVIYTGLGTAMLFGLHYFDFRKLRPYAAYLYAATMLLWFAVLMWGPSFDGKPFLALGPVLIGGHNHSIMIDYTGITTFFLALALSGIFVGKDWANRLWLMKAGLLLMIPNILYIISNTIHLAVIYTLVFIVLMAMAGAGKRQVAEFLLLSIGLFLIKITQAGDNFSLLRSADLWGQGTSIPGATEMAFHTDFVFLYLVHTFGWLAGALIVAVGGATMLVLIRSAQQIKDQFSRMIVAALATYFTIKFSWHILMSLGLAPVVSMGLPFISFGGSQTVVHLAAIGVILSIYKRKNLLKWPIKE